MNGEYRQLNDNVLQLENELYAPIRPKRTPRSGEKPSDALEQRGIEYIELRTVDVNPFTPFGIEVDQIPLLRSVPGLVPAATLPAADRGGDCP